MAIWKGKKQQHLYMERSNYTFSWHLHQRESVCLSLGFKKLHGRLLGSAPTLMLSFSQIWLLDVFVPKALHLLQKLCSFYDLAVYDCHFFSSRQIVIRFADKTSDICGIWGVLVFCLIWKVHNVKYPLNAPKETWSLPKILWWSSTETHLRATWQQWADYEALLKPLW